MAIIQQIIRRNNGYKQQNQQNNSDGLVGLRLLHCGAIFAKCIVSRHLLKQLGVNLVVIAVELPLVQSQSSNCALISDVENNMVVGLQTIVIPFYLWWHQRWISHRAHQVMTTRNLLQIVLIKIKTTRISKHQCALILAVDIREICRVRIYACHSESINLFGLGGGSE